MKQKRSEAEKTEALWGWLFIAPTMIGLIILNFYPMVSTALQSFCKTGDFGRGNTFIGLKNYIDVLQSGEFWRSLFNTFKYALIEVPFSVSIAFILAILLNRKIKGRSIYRTIFFLPMVAAPAAVAMVWKWLFNQQYGLLNHIFGTDIAWISNPNIAWISIGIIGVWSILGYNMVLMIGGLQEIPKDFYEAADIDGASSIRQALHITLPLLSPMIFFIVQTRIIGALQQFDLIYMVMDSSNPALSKVETVVPVFYKYAFTYGNKGYGATFVMLLLVVILFLTFLLQKAEKKWVHYN